MKLGNLSTVKEPEINEEEEMPEQDIFYVAESELKSLKEKLKESKDISKDGVYLPLARDSFCQCALRGMVLISSDAGDFLLLSPHRKPNTYKYVAQHEVALF